MSSNKKVEQIFTYLHSIKNINDKRIRNINEYEEVFFESHILDIDGCDVINSENRDEWLEINKNAKDIYNKFSKIYLKLQKNSENLEVIYAHGLLIGQVEDVKIMHPIFTTKMDLSFNDKNSVFSLKPYNNLTNIELDILSGFEAFPLQKIIEATSQIKSLGIDARNKDEVTEAIGKIVNILGMESNNYNYKKLDSLLDMEENRDIIFYDEPVIIFRKVDTRLWNMELNSMLEEIRKGYKIPKTIEALVNNEKLEVDEVTVESWKEIGEDLLFPLPYNEDQKEITKRLSENFGVVVQGPPGTGKSHTIVNLICHLLAHGKRVLVTSQTDRALKVLNNKIPEEIRSLCMSILGDDAKAMEDLDDAVRKITENLSLDTTELKKQFKFLKFKLKQCKDNQDRIYESLRKIEYGENHNVTYNNENYSLMDMAKYIRENSKELSYIDDSLSIKDKSPLTNEEFEEFLELLEIYSLIEVENYENTKEYTDKLPELIELVEKIDKYRELLSDIYIHRKIVSQWSDKEVTSYSNNHLLNLLDEAYKNIEEIENTYVYTIMKNYYCSKVKGDIWTEFIEHCGETLKEVSRLRSELNKHKVQLPENVDMNNFKKDFEIVDKVLREKGKIGTIFKLLHGNVKYILESVKIDYEPISTLEHAEVINNYMKLYKLERDLKNYYNNTMKEYGGRLVTPADVNFNNIIEDAIEKITMVIEWENNYKDKILGLLKAKHFNREINFCEKDSYSYIKDSLLSLKAIKEFDDLAEYLDDNIKTLRRYDCFEELADKIEENNSSFVLKYYERISYLNKSSQDIEKLIKFRNILMDSCPKFTKYILVHQRETLKLNFKNFEGAFKYKVWSDYITTELDIDIKSLERALYEEKAIEDKLVKEIVCKQSWYNQILRTTELQKRSLFTWMEAIKRIGKGTGTQAVKYRKIAQREMENCKDVIPVWIMPINRVIENLKINENLFDVIIVDESSQSDITALTALMRAERAVIVGDEKQISPEAIGKDSSMVEKLIETHLKGIPHAEWFDLKTSLYNTALRIFPNRLILKEHFRSVDEIIGFSNKLCYSNEIVPLRCGKNDNPLDKPIVTVKVEEAFRDESKAINIKEAYAIVDKIIECCNDSKYENMTMGVVSLLGDAQAEFIENLIIEKLGIEEMVKRRIVCGDAYSFQGDERDVMFLSFVIADNVKYGVLSKDSDIRRFNVAASRARNQMWLFHSVDLEDLNPKGVRHNLLEYAMEYEECTTKREEAGHYILTTFEEDVLKELKDLNVEVIPKVKVGKYEIDFVIKAKHKIAIECLGSRREEKYSWKESFERQHTLERVGWRFYKIRSSEFYLNPKETIKRLYDSVN